MAAVAFTETLVFRGGNGKVIHARATLTDIAAAFAIFPDGNSFFVLPSDQVYSLVDIIVVIGGTDTNQQVLFINGLNSGIAVDNKSNLNTANNRQFQQAPIAFRPGSMLRLTQAA